MNDVAYLGPDRALNRMDAQLTANCAASTPYSVSARMRFHERSDITPPGAVSGLKAVRSGGQVKVTWANPSATDLAGVIVRWYSASRAPGIWWAGNEAHFGAGASASFSAPAKKPVAVSVWAYDSTGNVSAQRSVHLP